jgi:hypothetical protein
MLWMSKEKKRLALQFCDVKDSSRGTAVKDMALTDFKKGILQLVHSADFVTYQGRIMKNRYQPINK